MRRDTKDITGQRFGTRVALRYVGDKKWLTRCDCGADVVTAGAALRNGKAGQQCKHPQGVAIRFWAKVEKTPTCWLWTGALNEDGYGHFKDRGVVVFAHRWAWLAAGREMPDRTELDHLCRTRRCIRIDHLEAVSHAENVRRGDLSRVTRERHAAARTDR